MLLVDRAKMYRDMEMEWCTLQALELRDNKEAIWLYAELFLGHHDGSCHGLW